jgi:hypothetical protein
MCSQVKDTEEVLSACYFIPYPKLESFLQTLQGFVAFQRHPNSLKTGNIFFNSEQARLHAEETYYDNGVRIKPMWKNNNAVIKIEDMNDKDQKEVKSFEMEISNKYNNELQDIEYDYKNKVFCVEFSKRSFIKKALKVESFYLNSKYAKIECGNKNYSYNSDLHFKFEKNGILLEVDKINCHDDKEKEVKEEVDDNNDDYNDDTDSRSSNGDSDISSLSSNSSSDYNSDY